MVLVSAALSCSLLSANNPDCTYILRFVEPNNRGEKNPYSLRQALVFHRCSSFSTWLFVALSKSMSLTLHSHLASRDDTLPENQFSLHLILINAAAATWRSYLSYIAEEVRNVVCVALRSLRLVTTDWKARQNRRSWRTLTTTESTWASSRNDSTSNN